MLPDQLAGFTLLSQETKFHQSYKDPYADPEAGEAIHPIGYLAAPSAGPTSVRRLDRRHLC